MSETSEELTLLRSEHSHNDLFSFRFHAAVEFRIVIRKFCHDVQQYSQRSHDKGKLTAT